MRRIRLLIFVLSVLTIQVKAQVQPQLSGKFDKVLFVDMVNQLEQEYNLKFFFNNRQC